MMNWLKRHFWILRRIIGGILLCAGFFLAYFWFYKLVPARHLHNPEWLKNHSEKERWHEEQADYKRMGSSPDLCFRGDRIGFYGDKNWFIWLVGKMSNPKRWRVCGCTETALMYMSNHEESSWEDWLKKNKALPQEKWIQDGFTKTGIKIHLPPKTEDISPLLKVLGQNTWNVLYNGPKGKDTSKAIPSYIKYNAFRWLRDSGFNPMTYAMAQKSIPDDIRKGLIQYSKFNDVFPASNKVGILSFTETTNVEKNPVLPPVAQRWFCGTVDILILGLSVSGILLLFVKGRKSA